MLSDKASEYKIFSASMKYMTMFEHMYVVLSKERYIPAWLKETKKTHLDRLHSSMLGNTTTWATRTVEFTETKTIVYQQRIAINCRNNIEGTNTYLENITYTKLVMITKLD